MIKEELIHDLVKAKIAEARLKRIRGDVRWCPKEIYPSLQQKYQVIMEISGIFPEKLRCEVMGIPRGSFYNLREHLSNPSRQALTLVRYILSVVQPVGCVRIGVGDIIFDSVDNGPEFISRTLDAWTYDRKIQLLFSRPGTPTDNAHIESFNGSLQEECLNTNWFMSLDDVKETLERWRYDYNEYRPHSALTYLPPAEFARNHAAYGP